MTIKDEALAELATNPRAKLFICSVPCKRCGGHERYISSIDCTHCKNRKDRQKAGVDASVQRLSRAVILYRSSDMSLGEVAKEAKVSNHRLSNELKRLGVPMRNYRNQGKMIHDPRADEFNEAKPSMLATKLFNDWYRSVHG